MSQSPPSSLASPVWPPGGPRAPPTSPTRKRVINSSDEDERPSPSKVTRVRGPELARQLQALRMNSSSPTRMSDIQNEPEATTTQASGEAASEQPAKPKWLRALPHALKLLSMQASLPGLQQILQAVKASIPAPEDATEWQKLADTKLAISTSRALLDKLAEMEKQITELREQAILLAKEEERMEIDNEDQRQEQGDDVSEEDTAAQVRSILAEASAALESAQLAVDKMTKSNDGGVRDAVEWWKSLAEPSP
ncbi:hypothetical protein F5Y06DRAFT_132615 [Hypoxylon sp. FL0890]|nr:hypothetical protein F5Y06DRAFT_132615 [Hypoxylon sp. FL0890]